MAIATILVCKKVFVSGFRRASYAKQEISHLKFCLENTCPFWNHKDYVYAVNAMCIFMFIYRWIYKNLGKHGALQHYPQYRKNESEKASHSVVKWILRTQHMSNVTAFIFRCSVCDSPVYGAYEIVHHRNE